MKPLHQFFIGLAVLYVSVLMVGIMRNDDNLPYSNTSFFTQLQEELRSLQDEVKSLLGQKTKIKKQKNSDNQAKTSGSDKTKKHKDEVKVSAKEAVPSKPVEVPAAEAPKPKKKSEISKFFGGKSPFGTLGAYPDVRHVFTRDPKYDTPHLGIINEDDYCDRADLYNLEHPEVLFEKKNFFTDYPKDYLPRKEVMIPTGRVIMPQISASMPVEDFESRLYPLKLSINNYFNNFRGAMDYHHELGKHFACATQMYNHIPGHGNLIQKDSLLDSFRPYVAKYADKPQCFNETSYFMPFFRLYDEKECKDFFNLINSQAYKDSLKKDPIQYLVKIARGSHKGEGVFLLDNKKVKELNKQYSNGEQCGEIKKSLIAQGYVSNPLLLDLNNKFDFRLYGLIASTNPLIMYYHDGFLRVALNKFDTKSKDKATHLTNTALAFEKINEADARNEKINNMSKEELEEYHLWSLERLEKYLLDIGRITDKNWLNNYLRPAIHRAIIHVVKMTSEKFLKHSNLYEIHGLDFILDNNFQVWFIESNPSPLLTGTTKHTVYHEVIRDSFDIMYAYYRSRMLRFAKLIKEMMKDSKALGENLPQWKLKFQEAAKNRLEPEFPISKDNTYTLIMDEGLEGEKAYMGLISKECVLNN